MMSPGKMLRQGTSSLAASMSPSVISAKVSARRSKRRKGVASYGTDGAEDSTHDGGSFGWAAKEVSDLETIPMEGGGQALESHVEWLLDRLSDPVFAHMVIGCAHTAAGTTRSRRACA